MKAEFGQSRDFKQVYGSPPAGQFAMDADPPKSPHWDHCREQFAAKWERPVEGFYFSHESGQSENVAGFICKTEEVLALTPPRTTYSKTDKSTILWVAPAPFWQVCEMRRSLFTILLRCGMRYNPDRDDFETALFGGTYGAVDKDQEYIRQTAAAVKRFLFGFTKYIKQPMQDTCYFYQSKIGWRETFKGREIAQVRQMLVLPEGAERFDTLIGMDALWA